MEYPVTSMAHVNMNRYLSRDFAVHVQTVRQKDAQLQTVGCVVVMTSLMRANVS
jgi:hypothetical protein